ncbi:MAG: flagellar motor switch protein FliN [Alphaproteobacteria bacterium]|nr:flagellar motor switch protein FliN [Alphaproteobacteria bacterium]
MASNIDNIKVEISVVLGRSVIPMHQLLRMGRGAVIELDSHQDDPVTILANDKPVAKGEIQIHGDKIGVAVVELLSNYEFSLVLVLNYLFSTELLQFMEMGTRSAVQFKGRTACSRLFLPPID